MRHAKKKVAESDIVPKVKEESKLTEDRIVNIQFSEYPGKASDTVDTEKKVKEVSAQKKIHVPVIHELMYASRRQYDQQPEIQVLDQTDQSAMTKHPLDLKNIVHEISSEGPVNQAKRATKLDLKIRERPKLLPPKKEEQSSQTAKPSDVTEIIHKLKSVPELPAIDLLAEPKFKTEILPRDYEKPISARTEVVGFVSMSQQVISNELEDNRWINNLMPARLADAIVSSTEAETKELSKIIVVDIQERMELPEDVVGLTETLVVNLPEDVREGLAEFMTDESREPEAVAELEQLVVIIAQAADRLHELAMTEQLEGVEAEEIQELLAVWYEEMLTTLGIEADEETIAKFIDLVCSEAYRPATDKAIASQLDPGDIFHERKVSIDPAVISGFFGAATRGLHYGMAKIMVRHTVEHPLTA